MSGGRARKRRNGEGDKEFPGLGKWVSGMRQAFKAELERERAAADGKPPEVGD